MCCRCWLREIILGGAICHTSSLDYVDKMTIRIFHLEILIKFLMKSNPVDCIINLLFVNSPPKMPKATINI